MNFTECEICREAYFISDKALARHQQMCLATKGYSRRFSSTRRLRPPSDSSTDDETAPSTKRTKNSAENSPDPSSQHPAGTSIQHSAGTSSEHSAGTSTQHSAGPSSQHPADTSSEHSAGTSTQHSAVPSSQHPRSPSPPSCPDLEPLVQLR